MVSQDDVIEVLKTENRYFTTDELAEKLHTDKQVIEHKILNIIKKNKHWVKLERQQGNRMKRSKIKLISIDLDLE